MIHNLDADCNDVFFLNFSDRSTAIGGIINDYLAKKIELAPEAVHLLFSANRWECKDGIREALEKGTTLIVDRSVFNCPPY